MNLKIERDKTIKVAVFWNYQTINILMQATLRSSAGLLLYDSGKIDGELGGKIEVCQNGE